MPTAALKTQLGDRLLQNEPLAKYTAARLGGPAEWLYVARESVDELAEVVTMAWAEAMPVRVLGGGANVLVSDAGVRGLVVINRVSEVKLGDWHDGRTLSATSGVAMTTLANRCLAQGLSGMEWAVSVPGTLGGAIVNNAGAHGADMRDSVADVVVLEPTGPKRYSVDDFAYDYRHSVLKAREDKRFLVLLATLILPADDPEKIQAKMAEFRRLRKSTQPPGASLGSIFKNPPGDYAGRLIEATGLKGHREGSAVVSRLHANFFINDPGKATGDGDGEGRPEASATDYYNLIRYVQKMVRFEQGVSLELEIELLGEWES